MEQKIRVLVADDHAVVRAGIRQILSDVPTMTVAGEARTGQEVISKVREEKWDVVVLDISLPDRSGMDVLKQIKSYYPKLPVLVLTIHGEDQYAIRLLRAGASGYLTKESAPSDLVAAIERVARGGRYISATLAERLVFDAGNNSDRPPHELLSDREFEVMCMLTSGFRVKDIAEKLCLSVKTVSSHRARILKKMQMTSNAALIQYALQRGLVQ